MSSHFLRWLTSSSSRLSPEYLVVHYYSSASPPFPISRATTFPLTRPFSRPAASSPFPPQPLRLVLVGRVSAPDQPFPPNPPPSHLVYPPPPFYRSPLPVFSKLVFKGIFRFCPLPRPHPPLLPPRNCFLCVFFSGGSSFLFWWRLTLLCTAFGGGVCHLVAGEPLGASGFVYS